MKRINQILPSVLKNIDKKADQCAAIEDSKARREYREAMIEFLDEKEIEKHQEGMVTA